MQSFLNIITLWTYTFFTMLTPRLHGHSKCFFRRPQNLNAPRRLHEHFTCLLTQKSNVYSNKICPKRRLVSYMRFYFHYFFLREKLRQCCQQSEQAIIGWMFDSSNPYRGQEVHLICKISRPTLRPTQPPIQQVQCLAPHGRSGWGVRMTTHLHLMRRLRMSAAIHPFPLHNLMAYNRTTLLCFLLSFIPHGHTYN